MDTRIILNKFNSKKSSNTSEGLNVQFKGKRKLLPLNDVAEVISQYDVYSEEREKCNVIRLTCQVNPICSNVLFNEITEVVKDEGSSALTFINYGVGDDSAFENVRYKEATMAFWSGGNMNYSNVIVNSNANNVENKTLSSSIIHPTNAIRDMQLSNASNGFIYHCGIDSFNNHLVRSKTFKSVCMRKEDEGQDTTSTDSFNTIGDLMRDVNGDYVNEMICFPVNAHIKNKSVALHLYEIDDLFTFEECVEKRLIHKYDGWLGFENRSRIKTFSNFGREDEVELDIERPLMYLNGGDFVDMYPGRDLYSFVPKYNEHRNRMEKNWNYCITYPSSSYTPSSSASPFSDIIEYRNGINTLKVVYFDENLKSDNGTTQIVMYGISKHGLKEGDYVNIYKTYENDENEAISEKIIDNAEVVSIINEYIFTVFSSDVAISSNWVYLTDEEIRGAADLVVDDRTFTFSQDTLNRKFFVENGDITNTRFYVINERYVNIDRNAQNISYNKVVGDVECDYYIRIFSKLPNFRFASGDTSSEYEIYRIREDGESMLTTYQSNEYEFESHVSKLAFADNIYSDEIGQIVFTDDIDVSNIHDNLGRPLTSLYLTFIKNNQGYKEWYGYDYQDTWDTSEVSGSTVEFSHAFGKITCGIETSYESTYGDIINSINRINNIGEINGDRTPSGYTIASIISPSERTYTTDSDSSVNIGDNEVSYLQDINFYGDLCCYDNYNAVEEHISYIMHRFNTAQRESTISESQPYFSAYTYDEIVLDDYDGTSTFTLEDNSSNEYGHLSNRKREGYYYNPHYEIPIKTFGKVKTVMPDFLTIRQIIQFGDTNEYQITTLEEHHLSKGDKSVIYDWSTNRYYKLVTIDGDEDNYYVFSCLMYDYDTDEETTLDNSEESFSIEELKLFKMDNIECPSYARILRDGTCRIIWRDVLNNGFNESDKTVEEYPFTNGAFYVNKKVDIYVRRQDPHSFYGLYDISDIEGVQDEIKNEDNYVKDTEIEC